MCLCVCACRGQIAKVYKDCGQHEVQTMQRVEQAVARHDKVQSLFCQMRCTYTYTHTLIYIYVTVLRHTFCAFVCICTMFICKYECMSINVYMCGGKLYFVHSHMKIDSCLWLHMQVWMYLSLPARGLRCICSRSSNWSAPAWWHWCTFNGAL